MNDTKEVDNVIINNQIIENFKKIYDNGGWNGMGSGPGSSIDETEPYRNFIQDFLKKYLISSVIDFGCGDWNFSKLIRWNEIRYCGVDVVSSVIENNISKYGSDNISFKCLNIAASDFQCDNYDLCIIKDVMIHLPNISINNVVKNTKKFKYCLITEPYIENLLDVAYPGECRPINHTKYWSGGEFIFQYTSRKTYFIRNA